MLGTVLRADEIIVEGVVVTLIESQAEGKWVGSLRAKGTDFLGSGDYTLRLSDGRQGTIEILQPSGPLVGFVGKGPLK